MSVLFDWLGSGGIPVAQECAQDRANICLKCPNNTPDSALTVEVAKGIKMFLGFKNRMKLRVDGEKSLHQCSVCTCALRLKIWTPIAVVRKRMDESEISRYPDFCWQKTEP